jgi:D-alanyl-D-alanine carboxypeptidase/D-alanyl-D-alanine-endopeptidase (penicillin-binding protein 4)
LPHGRGNAIVRARSVAAGVGPSYDDRVASSGTEGLFDSQAAFSKEPDKRLAGVSLLVRGRHDLYVGALAALLSSRGARVWESSEMSGQRLPRGVDVVVLESPLPAELREVAATGVPVIVLAERAEPADSLAAAQLGARALLTKNCSLAELTVAIRGVSSGAPAASAARLTKRQRQVLELIVEGLDNSQIAARLGVSERTARAHVSAVLERLGVANRTQAAVAAIQRGWLAMLIVLLTVLAVVPAAAAAAPTAAGLRNALAQQMRVAGGGSGAWVSAGSDAATFEWKAGTRRVPASVQKLVTTAAALDRLGPQARFETAVLAEGPVAEGVLDGDLYLRGTGDPTLGTAALRRLADKVSETGLEQVEGRVYGDESFFDRRRGGPASGFGISPYVGPLSALAFNRGSLLPFAHGWQSNPPGFAAERMRIALRGEEVDVERRGRTGRAPADATTLAVQESPPLETLVRHTNHASDNYYAEMLLKGLGARSGTKGSTAAGAQVASRFGRELRFRARIVDGSGLSRANFISPRAVGRLLVEAQEEPWFDSFYRSLPLAGKSGTLDKRMRGTAASGRCRAKTGTLSGVSALAGYCKTRSGRRAIFALLMNGVNLYAARRAQDRIAAAIAGS